MLHPMAEVRVLCTRCNAQVPFGFGEQTPVMSIKEANRNNAT
jgi:hypothetical protein